MIDYAKIIKENIDPFTFFENNGCELGKGRGGWADGGLCVFHEDTKKGTFKVSESGSYKCFSCGEKGGDIISFFMTLSGVDFITACKMIASDYSLSLPNQEIVAPIERGLEGQSHQKYKIIKMINNLSLIILANSDDPKIQASQRLWCGAILCKGNYKEAVKLSLSMLVKAYGDRGVKGSLKGVCRIYNLYYKMIHEDDNGFKIPLEIISSLEVEAARSSITFLKGLVK